MPKENPIFLNNLEQAPLHIQYTSNPIKVTFSAATVKPAGYILLV